jgi:hypothetical protein
MYIRTYTLRPEVAVVHNEWEGGSAMTAEDSVM